MQETTLPVLVSLHGHLFYNIRCGHCSLQHRFLYHLQRLMTKISFQGKVLPKQFLCSTMDGQRPAALQSSNTAPVFVYYIPADSHFRLPRMSHRLFSAFDSHMKCSEVTKCHPPLSFHNCLQTSLHISPPYIMDGTSLLLNRFSQRLKLESFEIWVLNTDILVRSRRRSIASKKTLKNDPVRCMFMIYVVKTRVVSPN